MFNRLKILILLATIGHIPAGYADWLSNQMYTLSPTVKIDGPVQELNQKKKYQSEIFSLILEEAEKLAKEYSDVGDTKAYRTFMLGALAIPYAEGQNIHFRKESNESLACKENSNSGDLLLKNKRASHGFLEIFKKENSPYVPNCPELIKEESVNRLIHGWDGSDIGIMQVNLGVAGHRRLYFSQGDWKSVRKSIRYGLKIFKKGFNRAYRDPRFCMLDQEGEIIYLNLIRGGWAGWYNSGNHQSNCRFADPNSPWAGNDRHMASVLERLLSMDKLENIDRHYPMQEKEANRMQNIVSSFKNLAHVEDETSQEQNQGQDQGQEQDRDREIKEEVEEVQAKERIEEFKAFSDDHIQEVTATNLYFRTGPGTDFQKCGLLPQGTQVKTIGKSGDWVALQQEERSIHENNPRFDCSGHEGKVYAHGAHLIDQGPVVDENSREQHQEQAEVEVEAQLEAETRAKTETETEAETKTEDEIESEAETEAETGTRTRAETEADAKAEARSRTETDTKSEKATPKTDHVKAIALNWLNVREDRPDGYDMAPKTGQILSPEEEIIIVQEIWNSSNSEHPWYEISSPYKGWVYGKQIEKSSD